MTWNLTALEGSRPTAPELHILLPGCGRPPRKAQPSLWGPGPSCHPLGSLLGSGGALKVLAQPTGTSKAKGLPFVSPLEEASVPALRARPRSGRNEEWVLGKVGAVGNQGLSGAGHEAASQPFTLAAAL